MPSWIKKALPVLVFLILICCVSLCITSLFYDPFDPRPNSLGDLFPGVYYKINPEDIIADIDKGNIENAFRLLDVELTVFPDIHSSGSFLWTQEDYMKITNAHLFYQTGETMEDGWRVYRGEFRVNDCSDDMSGFDSGEIRLFKRASGGGYDGIVEAIRPLEEILMYGRGQYGLFAGYSPSKSFESNLTAEDALQIAEQAIGREMRQKLSNDGCDISVNYYTDEYWNISYWWFTDNLHFNLDVDVNVNDEQFKIKSHVYKCERTICP